MCEMHSELFIIRVGNIFSSLFVRHKIFMEIYQCYNVRNASAIIFNSVCNEVYKRDQVIFIKVLNSLKVEGKNRYCNLIMSQEIK